MTIREVRSAADVEQVARLAGEIWRDHYPPIIGAGQVEYMLSTFQSPAAIAGQRKAGARYFLVIGDRQAVGYLAIELRGDVLFLSKIYIRATARRRGYAKSSVQFAKSIAVEHRCRSIELTVNRHNAVAIAAYLRLGFRHVGERVAEIGQGYIMDDYVLELQV